VELADHALHIQLETEGPAAPPGKSRLPEKSWVVHGRVRRVRRVLRWQLVAELVRQVRGVLLLEVMRRRLGGMVRVRRIWVHQPASARERVIHYRAEVTVTRALIQ
jgi:hypothetical protein